jgi:hypothetical protein
MPIHEADHRPIFLILRDLCEHRESAPTEEILKGVTSAFDPKRIWEGTIENTHNQIAMIGLLIEELGKRQIKKASGAIVWFCAWPSGKDGFSDLVPRAIRALESIGDPSILPILKHIRDIQPANRDVIDPCMKNLLGDPEAYYKYHPRNWTTEGDNLFGSPAPEHVLPVAFLRGADGELEAWLYAVDPPTRYLSIKEVLKDSEEISKDEFAALVCETRKWYGRYLTVEGLPIEILQDEKGYNYALRYDVNPPTEYNLTVAYRRGEILSKEEFDHLVAKCRGQK